MECSALPAYRLIVSRTSHRLDSLDSLVDHDETHPVKMEYIPDSRKVTTDRFKQS